MRGVKFVMFLESTTDQQFLDLGQQRQVEILAEHCTGIDEEIRTAYSREDAKSRVSIACGKLHGVCDSKMIQGALVRRTRELVEQYWGISKKPG